MSATVAEATVEYSVEGLAGLAVESGILAPELLREIRVREPQVRARLAHTHGEGAVRESFAAANRRAAGTDVDPIDVLMAMQFPLPSDPQRSLTDDLLASALAKRAGLPFVRIDPLKIDAKLTTALISRPFARTHSCLVLAGDPSEITVAVANPFERDLLDSIERFTQRKVRAVVAPRSEIQHLITDVYGFRASVTQAQRELTGGPDLGNLEQYVRLQRIEELEATDQHVVSAFEYLLHYALDQRASDIHIEPRREQGVVRLRIDGILHDVHKLPKVVHAAFVSRIKTLARLDIAEKRRPQDGRIKTSRGDREVELRVSTLPVAFGEKIVIRIFDPDVVVQDLAELGFFEAERKHYESFISRPHGLLLLTGPTGSGKTTTLYSTLRVLSSPEVNITTIEDPIEMVVEAFNQVAVQPKAGVTFASALRAILRQDPDIVMVGEIRDHETAELAIEAALTGHLVLSTLHTNDTATAVTRLDDLGIDPFLIASTLVGVVAQRLVRKVCEGCRTEVRLTPDQLAHLGLKVPMDENGPIAHLLAAHGEGCVACRGTGLRGRTGIFEVLPVTEPLLPLIHRRAPAGELWALARGEGMMSLRECAVRKLTLGITTFEEILAATADNR